MADHDQSKQNLWLEFLSTHQVLENSVPLFITEGGSVVTMPYGRNGRLVLQRSAQMDALMRGLGQKLIEEFNRGQVVHDGILYMMFRREENHVVPLYFGKAEIYGIRGRNLSENIADLAKGSGKFGRWGYNYAYHIGDLSAVTLEGHPEKSLTLKYGSWRRSLFTNDGGKIMLNGDVRFWACLWGADKQSIWRSYGSTRLTFEEYLMIGIASDLFPNDLLNHEGRNRK